MNVKILPSDSSSYSLILQTNKLNLPFCKFRTNIPTTIKLWPNTPIFPNKGYEGMNYEKDVYMNVITKIFKLKKDAPFITPLKSCKLTGFNWAKSLNILPRIFVNQLLYILCLSGKRPGGFIKNIDINLKKSMNYKLLCLICLSILIKSSYIGHNKNKILKYITDMFNVVYQSVTNKNMNTQIIKKLNKKVIPTTPFSLDDIIDITENLINNKDINSTDLGISLQLIIDKTILSLEYNGIITKSESVMKFGNLLSDKINYRMFIFYMLQIFTGIAFLQLENTVHNDLHPYNIFISKNNRIKIFDFDRSYVESIGNNSLLNKNTCKIPCSNSQCNINLPWVDILKILCYVYNSLESTLNKYDKFNFIRSLTYTNGIKDTIILNELLKMVTTDCFYSYIDKTNRECTILQKPNKQMKNIINIMKINSLEDIINFTSRFSNYYNSLL